MALITDRLKPIPTYLGVDDAETLTGVSKWTWRKYAYQRRVASTKVGRRLLIPVAEIERVMSESLRPADSAKTQETCPREM